MIADPADQFTPDAELRDTLHTRDGAAVSQFEVPFTDARDFLDDVAADYANHEIQDGFVRLAVVNGERPATLDQVLGPQPRVVPGGNRLLSGWVNKFVRCSYLARGQLSQLSIYCGPATAGGPANTHARKRNEETAKAIEQAMRLLKTGLHKFPDLAVRGGGIYVAGDFDLDDPDAGVERAPELFCATCGVPLHFANGAYRDDAMKTEVLAGTGRYRGAAPYQEIKRLDHIHDPEEAGKLV